MIQRLRLSLRDKDGHTLGLEKVTLLNTDLDRLVELGVKGILRSRGKAVVVLDIFLDGLTAVVQIKVSIGRDEVRWLGRRGRTTRRSDMQQRDSKQKINVPATVSFFQLKRKMLATKSTIEKTPADVLLGWPSRRRVTVGGSSRPTASS